MQSQNFTSTFSVEKTPRDVFDAINNVRGWWTGDIEGKANEVGDQFSYRYPGYHFSQQEVVELVPDQKIVWLVTDAHLEGYENPREWVGTTITFEIVAARDATEVHFSHIGLVPEFECFDSCSSGWGFFVHGSLQRLIMTGEGPATPPWE